MSDFTMPGSRSRSRPPLKERINPNYAFPKIFSANNEALPKPQSNTMLQIGGADGVAPRINLDSFATGGPNLTFRQARGANTAPTAVQSGDILGSMTGFGFGSTAYCTAARASIRLNAAEAWTDSNQGTTISFATTPLLSTTQTANATIDGTGSLTLAGSAPNIQLTNATSNWISWPTVGVAAPTFTTRSVGTKLVLYPNLTGASTDFAIGIESGTLWNSVQDTSATFKWYGGTTECAHLGGSGSFATIGTSSGMIFQDRSGSPNWQWYGSSSSARLHNGTADIMRVDSSGNICAAGGYYFGISSSFGLAFRTTNYHYFNDYDGNNALYLGGSGDKRNYYRNTTHRFETINGAAAIMLLRETANTNQYYADQHTFYTSNATALFGANSTPAVYPITDNFTPIGFGGLRWTVVYAVTGTINTSDETHKETLETISDAEMRAVSRVGAKRYQFKDSLEKKGDDARTHYGYTTQDWIEAYEAEGLDPWQHGAFCRDLAKINGEQIQPAHHDHMHTPPDEDDGTEREYQLGLRYDQCLVLQIESLRREVQELKRRIQ